MRSAEACFSADGQPPAYSDESPGAKRFPHFPVVDSVATDALWRIACALSTYRSFETGVEKLADSFVGPP
jgi:hypothetical protein